MSEDEKLRAEIKDWQDRRFTILTASIGLVTAVLGFKLFDQPATAEMWPWVSALLLLLLSSACILTWYAGRANAKIAAYLIVFHERPSQSSDGGWESRLHHLKESGLDRLNLNRLLIIIYLVLGLVSVIFPALRHSPAGSGLIVVIGAVFLFLSSLFFLFLKSPKERYIKLWEEVRDKGAH
jgi:O-antigen/teichoic acid export membrane protein